MTTPTTTSSTAPRVLAPRAATAAGVALVVAAAALELLPAPAPLRTLVALPLLVLVAGHSATRLVLDDGGTSPEPGHPTRGVLPVVLGVLALLAVVLLLGVAGIPIGAASVALGTAALALALLLVARRRTLTPGPCPASETVTLPGGAVLRGAGGVVLAAVVLGAAVAGAIALRPVPVERYSLITLADAGEAGRPVPVRAGDEVTVRWTLEGHGGIPLAPRPVVAVDVGGAPAPDVDVIATPPVDGGRDGATSSQNGAVVLPAPRDAGLHDVRITVDPAGPAPAVLVVTLEVSP